MLTLAFYPVDTWFFRESRPMDSLGGSSLGNQFPPSATSLIGAIRTRLGDILGLNWQALKKAPELAPKWWGNADSLGSLRFTGPWLLKGNDVYFPAPAHILKQSDRPNYVCLTPGKPMMCDLGNIRLPSLPNGVNFGVKPLEGQWLCRKDLEQVLSGNNTKNNYHLISTNDLFCDEYRLGIDMDHQSRSAIDGHLYQTRHIRAKESFAILLSIDGLPEQQEVALRNSLTSNPLLRLGGEGRMAEVRIIKQGLSLNLPKSTQKKAKRLAIALTDLPIDEQSWPLPGFIRKKNEMGIDTWQGLLGNDSFTLITMVSPKVRRQGGWDLLRHQPRPVRSFIPAGTVFFFNEQNSNQTSLHIGTEIAWGYGHLAMGWWNDTLHG